VPMSERGRSGIERTGRRARQRTPMRRSTRSWSVVRDVRAIGRNQTESAVIAAITKRQQRCTGHSSAAHWNTVGDAAAAFWKLKGGGGPRSRGEMTPSKQSARPQEERFEDARQMYSRGADRRSRSKAWRGLRRLDKTSAEAAEAQIRHAA